MRLTKDRLTALTPQAVAVLLRRNGAALLIFDAVDSNYKQRHVGKGWMIRMNLMVKILVIENGCLRIQNM